MLGEAEYRIEASGTWAPGVILFGPRDGRIYRVADTGGTASPLPLRPNPGKRFESPRFLPDGRHFIVNVSEDPA